jgi:hypothetical protein
MPTMKRVEDFFNKTGLVFGAESHKQKDDVKEGLK